MQHYYILHWSQKLCLYLFSEKYKINGRNCLQFCNLYAQTVSDTIEKQSLVTKMYLGWFWITKYFMNIWIFMI
jgi:hypothetical protein